MRKKKLKKGSYYCLLFFHKGSREFAILRVDNILGDLMLEGPVLTEKNGILPSVTNLVETALTVDTSFIDSGTPLKKNRSHEFFCQGITGVCDRCTLEVFKNGFKEMNPVHAALIDGF
jgi:hypothetical protein